MNPDEKSQSSEHNPGQAEATTSVELDAVHHYVERNRQRLAGLVGVFLVLAVILTGVAMAYKMNLLLIFVVALFLISARMLAARRTLPIDAKFAAAISSQPAKQTVTGDWSYYHGYSNLLPEFRNFKDARPGYTGFQIGAIVILATNTKWSMYKWMGVLKPHRGSQLTVQYSAIYPGVPLRILAGDDPIYDILG